MAEVNRAYDLLSDPDLRAVWERSHAAGGSPPAGSSAPGAGGAWTLDAARAFVLPFGKHQGKTLGEVAGVEPAYVAWIVRTLPDLPQFAGPAGVVLARLEADGWRETPRPARPETVWSPGWAREWTKGTPSGAPRPSEGRAKSQPFLDGNAWMAGLGLLVLGGILWAAGLDPETVLTVLVVVAIAGYAIWSATRNRR